MPQAASTAPTGAQSGLVARPYEPLADSFSDARAQRAGIPT